MKAYLTAIIILAIAEKIATAIQLEYLQKHKNISDKSHTNQQKISTSQANYN